MRWAIYWTRVLIQLNGSEKKKINDFNGDTISMLNIFLPKKEPQESSSYVWLKWEKNGCWKELNEEK